MTRIAKLKEVEVRELWQHEQYDFSAWLAKDDNIEYLNNILGLTLTDIDKEVFVGQYRCDIVAKDETTNDVVIVENQLDSTNHDHLGKIITYAAGLNAKYIVWIVREAKEEHRAAIEWLNNNSSKDVNFFLIEIHAYSIGESDPAPKFEVIEKPNDFTKKDRMSKKSDELNKTQSERLFFWEQFNQTLVSYGRPFNERKASTNHWYDVAIGGTRDAHLVIVLLNKDHCIFVQLSINSKDVFDNLFQHKEDIETAFGSQLTWERRDNKKTSLIKYRIKNLDFEDRSNYNELSQQAIEAVINMRKIFKKYL